MKGRLNGTEGRVLSLHSEPVRDNLNLGVAHCRCGPQPESWVRGEVSASTSTNTLLLVCICLQKHLPSSHRHVAHMSTAPTHTHPRWLKILERHHMDTHPFKHAHKILTRKRSAVRYRPRSGFPRRSANRSWTSTNHRLSSKLPNCPRPQSEIEPCSAQWSSFSMSSLRRCETVGGSGEDRIPKQNAPTD